MIEFGMLTTDEQFEIYASALQFESEHRQHVKALMSEATNAIAPSGSDLFKPELWKGIHWLWFSHGCPTLVLHQNETIVESKRDWGFYFVVLLILIISLKLLIN